MFVLTSINFLVTGCRMSCRLKIIIYLLCMPDHYKHDSSNSNRFVILLNASTADLLFVVDFSQMWEKGVCLVLVCKMLMY